MLQPRNLQYSTVQYSTVQYSTVQCSSHGTSNLLLSCSRVRASSRVKQGAGLLATSLLWNLLALSSWLSTQHTRIPDLATVITLVTGGCMYSSKVCRVDRVSPSCPLSPALGLS